MIKTVVLTGKEICVCDLGGFNTVVHNLGGEVIYASKYPNVIMGADNVAEIPQGAAKLISTTNGTVYLLGVGKAELTGQDHDSVNFRAPSSSIGGDGNSIAIKQYVDTALSSVNNALLEKADKSEILTTLPANGGNADTVGGHTVGADVPADAVFTDTTYSTATQTQDGLMSATDKTKLDGIAENANNYILPAATETTLGGVKVGDNLSISDGTLSAPIYSNPNLLDNPDFRINQRGQSTYTMEAEAYGVDRWSVFRGSISPISTGGVTYTYTSGVEYGDIIQVRPADGIFDNNTVTFSACVNGTIYSCTGKGVIDQAFTSQGHTFHLIAWENSYRIRFFGTDSYSATVSWMKLEPGSVATPFVPPSPAEELLKCMYYYERRVCPIESLTSNDSTWFAGIVFAVPKRIAPSVRYRAIYYNSTDVSAEYFNDMSAVYVAASVTDPAHSCTAGLQIEKGTIRQNDRSYYVLYEASADF